MVVVYFATNLKNESRAYLLFSLFDVPTFHTDIIRRQLNHLAQVRLRNVTQIHDVPDVPEFLSRPACQDL
jgi:hypothetical protein